MNGSLNKIIAPKPVKASSNIAGIKMSYNFESNFEKIIPQIGSHTPRTGNLNKRETSLNFSKFAMRSSSELYPQSQHRNSINSNIDKNKILFSDDGSPFSEFEKSVEKDFKSIQDEDSLSKSEILSILKNDSTFYESTVYRSENFFSHNKNDDEEFVFGEERISMPPIRTKNPFYKNFENENVENVEKIEMEKLVNETDDYFYNIGESYDPK